jgi:periplasmic protein TonB
MFESIPTEHIRSSRPFGRLKSGIRKATEIKAVYNKRKKKDPMFLLNDGHGDPGIQDLPSLGGGSVAPITARKRTLFESLTGEEKPHSIGSLLLILVCSLHLWIAHWLLQPVEPIKLAQPLMMEVSMVSAPGKQITTAPPAPPKPVEPVKKIKKLVKKPAKKKNQAKPKQAELPKPVLIPDNLLPVPSRTESVAEAQNSKDASTADSARKSTSGKQGDAEPYTEASFNANYGTNPKPKYPAIARSRGWQGKVLLRVSVSAEGRSVSVTVQRSSGHDVLDESAVAAVENWKFIPARRGNLAVACSVIVPIIFTLNH